MKELPENPTLKDFTTYFRQLEIDRGFDHLTILEKCLNMGEEVGELFKAVRIAEGMKTDPNSALASVEDELSDVFSFVLAVANHYDIDLEQAWRNKDEVNKKRTWKH